MAYPAALRVEHKDASSAADLRMIQVLVPFFSVGGEGWPQRIEGTSLIYWIVLSIPTAPTKPICFLQLADF